jgi:hypothetical protein
LQRGDDALVIIVDAIGRNQVGIETKLDFLPIAQTIAIGIDVTSCDAEELLRGSDIKRGDDVVAGSI